jgi:hypothetical protein
MNAAAPDGVPPRRISDKKLFLKRWVRKCSTCYAIRRKSVEVILIIGEKFSNFFFET